MSSTTEIAGSLVIAGGDGTVLLEFGKGNYSPPQSNNGQSAAMHHTPTSLSKLSHEQKDSVILLQQGQIEVSKSAVEQLQSQVRDLQARLNKNSRNFSKPPSSDDRFKPVPKSLRESGQCPTGGQKGHPGSTLAQVAQPDCIVVHEVPSHRDICQGPLASGVVAEVRQVFELPALRHEVTEYRAMQVTCRCGKVHRGRFAQGVDASVQYGPRAQAAMVHLNQNHAVPLQRTATLMRDLFDLPVSQAGVIKAAGHGAQILQPTVQAPTVQAIGQACASAPVAHADETGMRVGKTLHWLHTLATSTLTWLGGHAQRGGQAFQELGLPGQFQGVLVHDGWLPYKALACEHALCNAHHLRELTYRFEEHNQDHRQDWASDMLALLRQANHSDNLAQAQGPLAYAGPEHQDRVREFRARYEAILSAGEAQNPLVPRAGKRGKAKQSKATNLLGRLRQYSDQVWRFMSQANVPFTNNVAGQAMRMPKAKQKVSGCFRTPQQLS